MSDKLIWSIIAFGPTLLVGFLGLRAVWTRKDHAWADYRDFGTLFEWFAAPMIVISSPILANAQGFNNISAGFLSAGAVALFCTASNSFIPTKDRSLSMLLHRIVLRSGAGLGIAAFILLSGLGGSISSIKPSVYLFISIIWASFLGEAAVALLPTKDAKQSELGSSELFDRILEIAAHKNAKLEEISVIRSTTDCSECYNAAAVLGTSVVIFRDLIVRLKKPEVDAVIEHEIGHIADERLWTLDRALHYGSYTLLLALAIATEQFLRPIHSTHPYLLYTLWFAMFTVPPLLIRWYSKTHERKANQNVGILTDPLSAVSGFYKLHVLNHLPTSRPWWSRILSTHPCLDEELGEIAKRYNLSKIDIEATLERARQELMVPNDDAYELPVYVDKSDELVKRPRNYAVWPSVCLSIVVGEVFLMGCLATAGLILHTPFAWVVGLMGPVGAVLIVVLSLDAARNKHQRRFRNEVENKLLSIYRIDSTHEALVVDALVPARQEDSPPWQGAFLKVSDGELMLLGESDELRIPLSLKINVARWADENSSGREARMVLIRYLEGSKIQSVYVRILEIPERGEPKNWKQLEKWVKEALMYTDANLVSEKELEKAEREEIIGKTDDTPWFAWSIRVPIAAVIFVIILLITDFVSRKLGGNQWPNRIFTGSFATAFAGSYLFEWTRRGRKSDDGKK